MQLTKLDTILCVGAHADDIEIGCGATVLGLARRFPGAQVHWIVFSASGARRDEARASAEAFTAGFARRSIQLHEFRDGFFPYTGAVIKDLFEDLKAKIQPGLILTHCRGDLHQDHRLVSELTWNTWRHHQILEYEIPKYDGDLGAPNVFVPAAEDLVARKIDCLMRCFPSQARKPWFEPEVFRGLMRLRGVECNCSTKYAEAFYGRKIILEEEE